ncbi:MAG: peptidase U32 family protein [Pirellulales bacterium]
MANGANAVYFGLPNYSARYRATNFRRDELPAVMTFLHEHNVRGYVALNTLIFTSELADVAATLAELVSADVDAVIVQDLGVVELIRNVAPDLTIHGSTQMTLTEPRGVEFVRRLGVDGVIWLASYRSITSQRFRNRPRCRWKSSSTARCVWPTADNA